MTLAGDVLPARSGCVCVILATGMTLGDSAESTYKMQLDQVSAESTCSSVYPVYSLAIVSII